MKYLGVSVYQRLLSLYIDMIRKTIQSVIKPETPLQNFLVESMGTFTAPLLYYHNNINVVGAIVREQWYQFTPSILGKFISYRIASIYGNTSHLLPMPGEYIISVWVATRLS